MDINATLLVQMITFALFVWFTMRFVWPPISKALEDRQATITNGLAAAERGQRELELAKLRVSELLKEAKEQSASILERSNKQAAQLIEDAKNQAKAEGEKQLSLAKEQLAQEVNQAKDVLRQQVAALAVMGAEKLIEKNFDEAANQGLIDKLIQELN